MRKKIKICFYMTTILEHWGGLEKYLVEVSKKLNESGDLEIDIVSMDDDFSINFIKLLSVYNLKKINKKTLFKVSLNELQVELKKTKYFKCKNFNELRKKFQEYDLIYAKNELLEGFILTFLIGWDKIPKVIFGCHTSLYYPNQKNFRSFFRNTLYTGFVYKFLTKKVVAFHTINSFDTKIIKNHFDNKQVFQIPNPFNFEEFLAKTKKVNFKFNNKKTNILWIGTLIPMKGVRDLKKIIEDINLQQNYKEKINWIIAGTGPEEHLIKDLQKNYQNVIFLGFVDHEKIPSLINNCDLIISTSKVETFSYVTIEANCLDKPVFSYKTSGQKEIIEHGINGLLLENVQELEKETIKFVNECYNFHGISKYIKNKFNQEKIFNNLETMFKTVYSKKKWRKKIKIYQQYL